MFIAALFTIAKTWEQPKCPSTDEWIKKMWYLYTMEYYSAVKKNEIIAFGAIWMDLEIIILSEVSQTETNITGYRLYVESKKMVQMNLFTKHKQSQMQKTNMVTWGKERGEINWETGTDICTLLYIKQITNKDLLYSTGNSTQYSVMTYMGKNLKKEWIYIYIHITDSLCCTPETNTTL